MKKNTLILLLAIVVAVLVVPAKAQTNTNSAPTLLGGLGDFFNPTNTYGLINANELNTSVYYKRDSDASLNGAAFQLDWWITDQQGAFFGYEEYSDRSAYWRLGYQVRTVFKGVELSLGTGTRQNTDEDFGDVRMFVSPALTYRIFKKGDWDIRATAGIDMVSGTDKPNPFVGFTFRFLKL